MGVHFDLIRRLGAGHFGEVWLAHDAALDIDRAVKFIPPNKVLDSTNFYREAQTMQAVHHPNVVKVVDTGTLDDGRVYVSMEYLPKGSLDDEAKGAFVHLGRAKKVMVDVLRGLEHAHHREVLHRDIKPANILVGPAQEGILSDFGLAIPKDYDISRMGVRDYGYLRHLAPEVYRAGKYSPASDIYACGVTLYRLVNGDSYVPALSPPKMRAGTLSGCYPDRTHYRDFIPRNLRTVINRAMNIDPHKRFSSAEDMRHALEQIPVEMNWNERELADGIQWTCSWRDGNYEVTTSVIH